jgi:hypothetical protein
VAFESEVEDILRELLREPGALGAAVGAPAPSPEVPGSHERRLPLGNGAELVVAIADPEPPALATSLEQVVRDLRARMRLLGVTDVPSVLVYGAAPRPREALQRRVDDLLGALSRMHGAEASALSHRGDVLATAGAFDEARRDRLPFLRHRVDAEAARHRGQSSHAEVVGDDVYARSFWFEAYLVVFFGGPGWPEDFVRHRARLVARELAAILPHLLDEPPPSSAQVKPVPEA